MKINENLILKSDDTNWAIANSKIGANFKWSGGCVKVEPNQTYTFSKYGGNRFFVCLFKVEPKLGDSFDSARMLSDRRTETDTVTFTTKQDENFLFFYVDNNLFKPLYKLEKGTEATLYVPNKADLKDSSLYPDKVGGVFGRKYNPCRRCCIC